MSDTLQALAKVLSERKSADPDVSYVANLHDKGLNKILEKVGEEAIELILAAKDSQTPHSTKPHSTKEVIAETADLWFHCLVMLSHLDISHMDVLTELERRFGLSGLQEKAQRSS